LRGRPDLLVSVPTTWIRLSVAAPATSARNQRVSRRPVSVPAAPLMKSCSAMNVVGAMPLGRISMSCPSDAMVNRKSNP
jgi:hypothetical protein